MMTYLDYIQQNKDRFQEELFQLLRIPSVSAKPENKPDMIRCAQSWQELLIAAGANRAEVMPSKGNPIVFGEYFVSSDAPTVLVYAHYDVMPAEPFEKWNTPPFEPHIIDGKIVARGADDDKGQSFIQLKAFETMHKTGQLATNVKFLIEGEEEIGSPSLEEFCKEHKSC